MMCDCTVCHDCKGSGIAWFKYGNGEYLGRTPMDDMDDLGECPTCEGTGYSHFCRDCYQDEEDRYNGGY